MRRLPLVLTTALTLTATGLSVAAAPPADGGRPGRYTLQPIEGGMLRLDSETGDVALCKQTGADFECKPVKDDRDLQTEITRLADENKHLKAEIKRLEDMLGLGQTPPQRKLELPSEQDVDKALSYLERMFKKFRDKLNDLDKTTPGGSDGKGGKDAPGGSSPGPERKTTPL